MPFDKNQTDFPTQKHKRIWYCGVLIMPEELTLSDKVKALMDADLYESCRQMRLFMLHSLSDMYENAERYDFKPWQLFSFWLNIADNGVMHGALEMREAQAAHEAQAAYGAYETQVAHGSQAAHGTRDTQVALEALDRLEIASSKLSKSVAANAKGLYEDVLANTGIEFIEQDGIVAVTNKLYPKMFRAMKAMQKYVREKKERASLENSFQICDFRKICPGYKYDKAEKRLYMRELEDRIPLILEGDTKTAALEFAAHLRAKNINLKWTGIQNGFSETGQTHYGQGLCHIELRNDYWEDKSKSWRVCVPMPNIEAYRDTLIQESLQHFIWDHIYICNKTAVNACNGGEKSIYACHRGIDITVLGKEIVYACRLRNGRHISVYAYDPDEPKVGHIKRLLELEQAARIGKKA